MTQLLSTWDGLEGRQRLVVVLAIAAAVLAMVGVYRLASKPDMALLYGGLDAASAGEVVTALEAGAVPYEVRGNAVYVPSALRDQTRLTLAGDGLPAVGTSGYELLDTLSGFGTTSQMFDATYWRAKEGELARTILASRDIRAARVHIANASNTPFARNIQPSASVTVTMARGALSPAQAEAIQYMVAAAVTGLEASEVAVLDSEGGVILAGADQTGAAAALDATQSRAETMRAQVERVLEARVGPGKAVVEVNLDTDMDSQTITERIVDPTSRVTVSSDTEERSETASGGEGGGVTVASNLPDGDVEAGAGASNRTTSQTREIENFEVSETRRERTIQPGQIRKISVAVIVDGITQTAADGSRTWQPRSDEELTALRGLVEAAVGFDPARGDVVTLETLEFPSVGGEGTLVADGGGGLSGDMMRLIQTAILGLVALLLGLFVIRPILTQPPALPAPEPGADGVEILDRDAPLEANFDPDGTQQIAASDGNKIKNLRAVITERADESTEVLRRWIDAPDEETA